MLPSLQHRPPSSPRQVGRLLQLVVGNGEGLVLRSGVGSKIGAKLQGGELGQCLLGHGQKNRQRNTLRAAGKQNSANSGKFVRDSYKPRISFLRMLQSREFVNVA